METLSHVFYIRMSHFYSHLNVLYRRHRTSLIISYTCTHLIDSICVSYTYLYLIDNHVSLARRDNMRRIHRQLHVSLTHRDNLHRTSVPPLPPSLSLLLTLPLSSPLSCVCACVCSDRYSQGSPNIRLKNVESLAIAALVLCVSLWEGVCVCVCVCVCVL